MISIYVFLASQCNIDVLDASNLDMNGLELNFKRPVRIRNMLNWSAFSTWATSDLFAQKYGSYQVNANRTSYAYGTDHTTISEYMVHADEHIIVMDDDRITSHENKLLNSIFNDFQVPKLFENVTYARVLSLGGGRRGVEMMQHCVAWIGMVAGRKRWYLADPKHTNVHANCDSEGSVHDDRISDCVIEKGDVMYVPDYWWHATCNIDPYTVAVGTQCESKYYTKTRDRWMAARKNCEMPTLNFSKLVFFLASDPEQFVKEEDSR